MTATSNRGFVRLHDGWMFDEKIGRLFKAGAFDAVALFFAMIAYSHSHETDGVLTSKEVRNLSELCSTGTGARLTRIVQALRRSELVSNRDRTVIEIVAYRRWQTTSDQRESHAERMRKTRARAPARSGTVKSRESLDREIEREIARATHVPSADDDDPGVVSLRQAAQERIDSLRRQEPER